MAGTATRRKTRPSADASRGQILGAALEAFSESGFDGASTREIAARAGVAQSLLNYHFRSKDELWRTVVDALFEELTRTMAERAEGLQGVDEPVVSRLLLREFIVFSARHPELHRIITQESKVDGPRMDWLVDHHVRPIYETIVERVRRLQGEGLIAPIPAEHLYYIVTGAGPSMFVLGPECRRLTGIDPRDDAVIEAHAEAMSRLLFGDR